MARVNVDSMAFVDARFEHLAELRGYADGDHARGKMLKVWHECVNRMTMTLAQRVIDTHLGVGGAHDLLVAELAYVLTPAGESAEPASISPAGDSLFRIRGTAGRTDYLAGRAKTAQRGGKVRAASAPRTGGRFTSKSDQPAHQPDVDEPAGDVTSALAPSLAPLPDLAPDLDHKKSAARYDSKAPAVGHQLAIDDFTTRFRKLYNGQSPGWRGTNARLMSELIKEYGVDVVRYRMANMFDAPPPWPKGPYDMKTFRAHFDKFAEPYQLPSAQRGAIGHYDPSMNNPSEDNDTPPWELK